MKLYECWCSGVPVHFPTYVFIIYKALNVEGKLCGVATHQFLEFLTLLCQSQQSSSLGLYIHHVLGLEFSTEVINQPLVKVFPSQIRIKGSRQNLQNTKRAWECVKIQSWDLYKHLSLTDTLVEFTNRYYKTNKKKNLYEPVWNVLEFFTNCVLFLIWLPLSQRTWMHWGVVFAHFSVYE